MTLTTKSSSSVAMIWGPSGEKKASSGIRKRLARGEVALAGEHPAHSARAGRRSAGGCSVSAISIGAGQRRGVRPGRQVRAGAPVLVHPGRALRPRRPRGRVSPQIGIRLGRRWGIGICLAGRPLTSARRSARRYQERGGGDDERCSDHPSEASHWFPSRRRSASSRSPLKMRSGADPSGVDLSRPERVA